MMPRLNEDIQSSLDTKIEQQVEKPLLAYKEREERKCNIILHNVSEPTGDDKKKEDLESIMNIARSVKCDEIKVESFFRLGKPTEGKKRLIKVCLDSVSSKHKMLGGGHQSAARKEGWRLHICME